MTGWRPSVRTRIAAFASLLFAALAMVAAAGVIGLVENDVRRGAEDSLRDALEAQARELGADVPVSSIETAFALTIDGKFYELGLFNELSGGNAGGNLSADGELVAVLEIDLTSNEIVGIAHPLTGDELEDPQVRADLRDLTFQLIEVETPAGPSVLVGASTLAELDEQTRAVRRALTISLPGLVAAFGVLVWVANGRAMSPVTKIRRQVERISTGSLDQRVPVPGGRDEVTELAEMVNTMLARLETGDARQRQFSSDASHELRSPLTVVRTAAESITRRTTDADAAQLATHIVDAADRMDALIAQLLDLSRASDGTAVSLPPVDIAEVARRAVALVGPHDGIEISTGTAVAAPAIVAGHEQQLEQLAVNLLANACRHAASEVRLDLVDDDGTLQLTVEDDGPGIAPTDRERVFGRFVRLGEGRDRDDGGVGLGLAIAAAISRFHGGEIHVDDSPALGGARFAVRFAE